MTRRRRRRNPKLGTWLLIGGAVAVAYAVPMINACPGYPAGSCTPARLTPLDWLLQKLFPSMP